MKPKLFFNILRQADNSGQRYEHIHLRILTPRWSDDYFKGMFISCSALETVMSLRWQSHWRGDNNYGLNNTAPSEWYGFRYCDIESTVAERIKLAGRLAEAFDKVGANNCNTVPADMVRHLQTVMKVPRLIYDNRVSDYVLEENLMSRSHRCYRFSFEKMACDGYYGKFMAESESAAQSQCLSYLMSPQSTLHEEKRLDLLKRWDSAGRPMTEMYVTGVMDWRSVDELVRSPKDEQALKDAEKEAPLALAS